MHLNTLVPSYIQNKFLCSGFINHDQIDFNLTVNVFWTTMAHKKKIDLFMNIQTNKEFHSILNKNRHSLICAEIYNEFSGSCMVCDRLFTTIKLDWSDNTIILLKVLADEIEVLKRFRGRSEPVYLFIYENKITKVLRGVNAIKLAEVAKKEIEYHRREQAGEEVPRETFALDEWTPEDLEYDKQLNLAQETEMKSLAAIRSVQQELRKRRRAELMVPHLGNLNFVLFWPQSTHAHFELYERWAANNIIMVGREEIRLDEYKAKDVLYHGDAPINEASIHELLSAPALVICFRCLDDDVHFVSLVRKILYEYIEPLDPAKPSIDQPIQKTAFNHYKHFSLTREEIWRRRRDDLERRKAEAIERRARRLSEMQRLAREAIKEELDARKFAREQEELQLLRTGALDALEELKATPVNEETGIVIPEDLSDEEEDFDAIVIEDKSEYFPPPGLLIPGFYAPPNDIAKANGLAVLFPKLVLERVVPEPEFLPPHVLVMLDINKRYKAIAALTPHRAAVIHMGIFRGTGPTDAERVAYSVSQYDRIQDNFEEDSMLIAFMLSTTIDIPLLQLTEVGLVHVSRDELAGELECIRLFPVYYSVEDEFEDFEAK